MTNIKLKDLDFKHPTYLKYKNTWKQINELYEGGSLLENNIQHYLPKRPGEPQDLYNIRISKLDYNNILSKSINTLVNKLSTGSIEVSNGNSKFWLDFRSNLDLKGLNDDEFINNVFREVLLYGRTFVHIDKTTSDITPRNLKEEKELGLRPYLTTYNAEEVLDWEFGKTGLKFVKVRQEFLYRPNLFSTPMTKVRWSYITDTLTAVYEVIVSKDSNGNVTEVINPDGSTSAYDNESEVYPTSIIEHGYGVCPVKALILNPELWVTGLVIHKLKQSLALENYIADALSIGTHLQRTYKPYTDPNVSKGAFMEDSATDLKLGNASVIKVDKYEIVEMEGTATTVAMQRLKDIQQELSNILTMKNLTNNNYNYEASSVSKEKDFILQEQALINYGKLLREFYQEILLVVARIQNISDDVLVSGFVDYNNDSIQEMMILGQSLITVKDLVPPIAKRSFALKFSKLIMNTNNPQTLAQLQSEIAAMDVSMSEASIAPNKGLGTNQPLKPKRINETDVD